MDLSPLTTVKDNLTTIVDETPFSPLTTVNEKTFDFTDTVTEDSIIMEGGSNNLSATSSAFMTEINELITNNHQGGRGPSKGLTTAFSALTDISETSSDIKDLHFSTSSSSDTISSFSPLTTVKNFNDNNRNTTAISALTSIHSFNDTSSIDSLNDTSSIDSMRNSTSTLPDLVTEKYIN